MMNPKLKEAFETDDLDFVRNALPDGTSEDVIEMSFHKARLAALPVSVHLRRKSAKWLKQRGLTDMTGRDPWEAIGETPQ